MSVNVDNIPEGKSVIMAKVVELLEVVSISIGNSVVSRGIWGKYVVSDISKLIRLSQIKPQSGEL